MSHRLIVTGDRACFRRAEIAFDQVSYDVITPLAARGLFEAVHWTPSIRWMIQQITILNPIRRELTQSDRPSDLGRPLALRTRRLYLADVAYLVEARFVLTDRADTSESAAQHASMFRRRARANRFFRAPYLGRRDLPARIDLLDENDDPPRSCFEGVGPHDFGWSIYDHDPDPPHNLMFYRPTAVGGVIDLTALTPADLFV